MKNRYHVAIAQCQKCKEYLVSEHGGQFNYCQCKESFIDQERSMGLYVRLGGDNCEFIEQICPPGCKCGDEHNDNRKLNELEDLKDYLKKTYKYKYLQKLK